MGAVAIGGGNAVGIVAVAGGSATGIIAIAGGSSRSAFPIWRGAPVSSDNGLVGAPDQRPAARPPIACAWVQANSARVRAMPPISAACSLAAVPSTTRPMMPCRIAASRHML